MGFLETLLLAAFMAIIGAIVGAVIASEIGIRRTEKRLRRLVQSLMPEVRRRILEILSDEEIKTRARKWVDDVLISRAPEIVRNLVRSAINGARPALPPELKLISSEKERDSDRGRDNG